MPGKLNLDKHPQMLHLNDALMTVANTAVEAVTNTPVAIAPDRSYVMEILKVKVICYFYFESATGSLNWTLTKRTKTAPTDYKDPDCIAGGNKVFNGTFAQGASIHDGGWEIDLQANDGKGYLFSGHQLFLQVTSSGATNAKADCHCMVLYRLVEATAEELVGIATESAM